MIATKVPPPIFRQKFPKVTISHKYYCAHFSSDATCSGWTGVSILMEGGQGLEESNESKGKGISKKRLGLTYGGEDTMHDEIALQTLNSWRSASSKQITITDGRIIYRDSEAYNWTIPTI